MAANDNSGGKDKDKKDKSFKKVTKWLKKNIGEIRLELKRVTWPTWKELFNYTVTVLLVCVIMGVLIYLLDIGLKRILLLTLQVGM